MAISCPQCQKNLTERCSKRLTATIKASLNLQASIKAARHL